MKKDYLDRDLENLTLKHLERKVNKVKEIRPKAE